MSKDQSEKPNLFTETPLGCAVIVIIPLLFTIFVFIGVYNDRKERDLCVKTEIDASEIAAEIADYFSIPAHTQISTADIRYKSPQNNTFTITATDPSIVVTITVTESSGKCPLGYQNASKEWNGSGVFTKTMSP